MAANAQAVAERIGGQAHPFDVADPDAAAAAVEAIGPVDILVANHAFMTMAPFEDSGPGDWARTIDVNLLGTATLLELVAPGMVERGLRPGRRDRLRVGRHRLAERDVRTPRPRAG